MSDTYLSLLTWAGDHGDDEWTWYWLASRHVTEYYNLAHFGVYCLNGGDWGVVEGQIDEVKMYDSDGYETSSWGEYLRPLVSIPLSSVNIGATGSGTKESPYSLSAR